MWPTYLLPLYLADNHSSRRVDEGECAKNIYQTHCGFPQKQQKERERERLAFVCRRGEGWEAIEEGERGPLLTFLPPLFPRHRIWETVAREGKNKIVFVISPLEDAFIVWEKMGHNW